ncbi:hypothetical protein E4T50_01957 [Aureobasidium sp. EXF-12298]|nr:hypothetical protein E4T50_01957 [Aureobasidium sp. EXF-12298]KAI4778521.1 hypothetical protein E4T52_06544 [Aureobasidium sp. EXF-3400]
MDFLMEELERMGANAIDSFEDDPSEIDIKRWQALFSMTHEDAQHNLKAYRDDLNRHRVSDEFWLDMKASKEAQGFDREAYEYDMFCRSKANLATPNSHSALVSPPSNSPRGLLLDGPLGTPEDIRDIAGFAAVPTVVKAESEDKSTSFCYVTAEEEHRIRQGLKDRGISFEPCFITINIAAKDISALPKLGFNDPTLPQHRLDSVADLHHGYPVLYFFYGTLAQPKILKRVLELETELAPSNLQPAHVLGGTITTLGQYLALINSNDPSSRVDGCAFAVLSEDQERSLRLYETNMYEVVCCDIMLAGEGVPVRGLTFRLAASG